MYSELAFLIVSTTQVVLIVVAVLLLFGGTKIPELMRGLGSGIKEFKNASRDGGATKKTDEKSKVGES